MANLETTLPPKTVGFIVNPVAGMGGAVGLKGTDGKQMLQKAKLLGAKPIAADRADTFLTNLSPVRKNLKLLVGAGDMGENEAEMNCFNYEVIGARKNQTTAQDTQNIVKEMLGHAMDLIVFCGGDGTARDILNDVTLKVPVLGVPTGVKMHSAVFAVSPRAAARVAARYLWNGLPLREAEVMDIDEEAFRLGHLSAKLYGYVLSPFEPHLIQGNKLESPTTEDEVRNQAAIAIYIIEDMSQETLYIMGPGTTTRTIADLLDQKKTLLGVDIILNKKIIQKDVNESQIIEAIKGKVSKIVVTPIGGQGFIFGRGNQQISSTVIHQVGLSNIIVLSTKSKLDRLRALRVDTGDSELDKEFRTSEIEVITDYKTIQKMNVE